jgi:hypothetical protein
MFSPYGAYLSGNLLSSRQRLYPPLFVKGGMKADNLTRKAEMHYACARQPRSSSIRGVSRGLPKEQIICPRRSARNKAELLHMMTEFQGQLWNLYAWTSSIKILRL